VPRKGVDIVGMMYFKNSRLGRFSYGGDGLPMVPTDGGPTEKDPTLVVNQTKSKLPKEFNTWCMRCDRIPDTKYPMIWTTVGCDNGCCIATDKCFDGDYMKNFWKSPDEPGKCYICSGIDESICSAIPGIKKTLSPKSVSLTNPGKIGDRSVTCTYDMTMIAQDPEATEYYIKQQRNLRNDQTYFDDSVMRAMCSLPSSDPSKCPAISKKYTAGVAGGSVVCSNMLALPLCKSWANTASGGVIADEIMQKWCDDHVHNDMPLDDTKSDPTCACWKRMLNPKFDRFEQMPVDAGCWYKPCVDQTMETYMVPSKNRNAKCDNTVCTQVTNFINNGSVKIDDMKQDLACTIVAPTPGPTPTPRPPAPAPVDGGGGSSGWWNSLDSTKKIAVVGGGTGVAIVLFLGIAFTIKKMRA
jgi:hypothetical protein